MRKIYLGLIISLLTSSTFGQQIKFEQVLPLPPVPQNIAVIAGVNFSSTTFADIDNDNDQDLLITGETRYNNRITKLYENDGNGNFAEVKNTPFPGVRRSSVAFSDIDNDNDLDVLITGEDQSFGNISMLYINDGKGNYTKAINTQFIAVSNGSVAFADIDNDNDQDLLITGENESNNGSANLYRNDGSGNFSFVSGTPFEAVRFSSIGFADIDNDSDQDLLIIGLNATGNMIAKLYCNDGNGNYTEVPGASFVGDMYATIAFSDNDNDNDVDVLISGNYTTRQYTNDGNGNFIRVIGAFGDESSTSLAIADIDNDNDVDVLLYRLWSHPKLYTNDGSGNFTFDTLSYFDKASLGSLAFADIDNDNDYDVLISGSDGYISTKLYINNGTGNFTVVTGASFDQSVSNSPCAFADIDNDSDQDILFIGNGMLYTNDGTGNYTKSTETLFEGISGGSMAFADIDNDNDQDLLITGYRSPATYGLAELYKNDGEGNYTEIIQPLIKCYSGTVNFADIDNDNDQDLLITGGWSDEYWDYPMTQLYINNGIGVFTPKVSPLVKVIYSAVAFADIDNDYDQDVIISGNVDWWIGGNTTKLYTNDGNGSFTEVLESPLEGVTNGSITFADIDNDEDQDLFINGNIFLNNGSGYFVKSDELTFEWRDGYSCKFVDIDNDNDQDIFITGLSNTSTSTKLFSNDGSGNFTEVSSINIDGVMYGGIHIADIDNDNDQDVLIRGTSISGLSSKLYRNISILTDGTFEDGSMDMVTLFPNPTNGLVNIELGKLVDVSIKVTNIGGSLIYHEEKINASSYQLEIVGTPGIYIVEVASGEAKQVAKVVKK